MKRKLAVMLALICLAGCQQSFRSIKRKVMIHSGDVHVLESDSGGRVLVVPGLMGRVLTSSVGGVELAGFVSLADIEQGGRDIAFNNFGGQDRFWIGPEAGQFGIYFKPGDEVTRETWRVPPELNRGVMPVISTFDEDKKVVLGCDMVVTNYLGVQFRVRVRREIGLVPAVRLNEEIGVPLPEGVSYVGSYSLNTLTNAGDETWEQHKGLLCIWILGQFNTGPRVAVIAPMRAATEGTGSSARGYSDDYFGTVPPERLVVQSDAVVFRADGSGEGKFGIGPERTAGVAGAYDPDRDLLIIVKFDVRPEEPLYASFHWGKKLADPFVGDVFQAYNTGGVVPGEVNAQWPFYELESVSPCRELAPGEAITHRHATFAFTGVRKKLDIVAREVLGLSLNDVVGALP